MSDSHKKTFENDSISVVKNRDYKIDITGMNHEGQGVGRVNGFIVFVDDAITGETAEVKIIKVNKSYAVGKLLKVLVPSASRAAPFCESYKTCGGCSLQHMSYPAQLEFKMNTVVENLRRIGKLEGITVHEIIGMQEASNYRNKAQFPVGSADGKPVAGFYARRSHNIIESSDCIIQDKISDKVRLIVTAFMEENGITAYDEMSGKGLVRHIMTRVGFRTGEVMVVLVLNGRDLPKSQRLIEILTAEVPGIKSIMLNINTKNTNVILGEKNICLFGADTITDYIGSFKFIISPHSFFQVNPVQTEVLYGKALEYAGLTGKETVFDLYCGIGTISLFLSQKANKVYGVEIVEAAIKDARENARINDVQNVEFIIGEAENVIPKMYAGEWEGLNEIREAGGGGQVDGGETSEKQAVRAHVVVLDPPRKGCDEALLKTLVDMRPERIVYVSCNPSTLARDLKYLSENGFTVREVQPVDMFPHTAHVECVVLITRKDT